MDQKVVRMSALLAVLMAASAMLGACGATGGGEGKSDGGAAKDPKASTASKEPVKIDILTHRVPGKESNPEALELVQKHTNTKLNITFVPNAQLTDKVTAAIAANDLPDVVTIFNPKDVTAVLNAMQQGVFWDLTPYLKDYPNIMKLHNEETKRNMMLNGKHYFVALAYDPKGGIFTYRKDWAEKLGLKEPTTIDEFYQFLKAFAEKDPDGNGKADTFGIVEDSGGTTFNRVKLWFGAPNGWGEQGGKLVPEFMTGEYVEAMKFMKKLYAEKLINQDFPVVNVAQFNDYFYKGRGGIIANTAGNLTSNLYDAVFTANPSAKLDLFSAISGPKGVRILATNGYSRSFLISKAKVKTEVRLWEILSFYNTLAALEMTKLMMLGIENKHYKLENGKPVQTEGTKNWADDLNDFGLITPVDPWNGRFQYGFKPTDKKAEQTLKQPDSYFVYDPTWKLYKEASITVDNKIILDARIKFILGELDEAGWEAAVERWTKSGGDKLIEEYSRQYAALKK